MGATDGKGARFLAAACLFLALAAGPALAHPAKEVPVDDSTVVEAADWYAAELASKDPSGQATVAVESILSAQRQVVNGYNYELVLVLRHSPGGVSQPTWTLHKFKAYQNPPWSSQGAGEFSLTTESAAPALALASLDYPPVFENKVQALMATRPMSAAYNQVQVASVTQEEQTMEFAQMESGMPTGVVEERRFHLFFVHISATAKLGGGTAAGHMVVTHAGDAYQLLAAAWDETPGAGAGSQGDGEGQGEGQDQGGSSANDDGPIPGVLPGDDIPGQIPLPDSEGDASGSGDASYTPIPTRDSPLKPVPKVVPMERTAISKKSEVGHVTFQTSIAAFFIVSVIVAAIFLVHRARERRRKSREEWYIEQLTDVDEL